MFTTVPWDRSDGVCTTGKKYCKKRHSKLNVSLAFRHEFTSYYHATYTTIYIVGMRIGELLSERKISCLRYFGNSEIAFGIFSSIIKCVSKRYISSSGAISWNKTGRTIQLNEKIVTVRLQSCSFQHGSQ